MQTHLNLYKYDLPNKAITLNGDFYNPNMNHWVFYDGSYRVHFYFRLFKERFSQRLFVNTKKCFMHYISNYAHTNASKKYYALKHFVLSETSKEDCIHEITPELLANYYGKDQSITNKEHLKSFLKIYYSLNLEGLDENTIAILNKISIPKRVAGLAVKTHNPEKGPLSPLEKDIIKEEINTLYATNKISLGFYIIFLLLINFALRPRQLSWLKIRDFRLHHIDSMANEFVLSIPRDKQGHAEPRVEFTERKLHHQLGQLILEWSSQVKNEYKNKSFYNKQFNAENLPLFPQWSNNYDGTLKYHYNVDNLKALIAYAASKTEIISHRTGKTLHINSRRFRYTIGTLMAIAGCGRQEIANALDHSSIQTANCYIEEGQAMAQAMNAKMAPYFDPVVRAFMGEIFDRPNIEGTRKTYSPVLAVDVTKGELGFCIKNVGCGIFVENSNDHDIFIKRPPYMCLTCLNFNAFDNLELFEELLEIIKREKDLHLRAFKEDGPAVQPSMALYYDAMLVACQQIILRIMERDVCEFDLLDEDEVDSF